MTSPLPNNAEVRKGMPVYSGFIKYFPHAIAACSELSRIGNEQHHPGAPLHWDHTKSKDELDALLRHLSDHAIDPEHRDPDGILAAVKILWRAAANLERMHRDGVNIYHAEKEHQ
tara:strand:- start:761 stop:1105 length:345 start_codon:yes stop_codon:yes gene_type:complete